MNIMTSRTVRHLKAIGTGLKHLLSSRLTIPYPYARQTLGKRYRGMIILYKEKCTSCMLCARICPSNAIKMRLDGKKLPGIDYARCVFCGYCVDVCPTRALEHSKLHDVAYLDYEENKFPPSKLIEGGKDPYRVPGGYVMVEIDEKKGLIYVKEPEKIEKKETMVAAEIPPAETPSAGGPEK